LPEVIKEGITGRIFKANDIDDLAEKIIKVLEKDFKRERIIQNSYERVNPRKEFEKLLSFFENRARTKRV